MKRLSLLILLFLSACQTQKVSIPLFIYDLNDPYMASFAKQIEAEMSNQYLIKTYDAANSQIIQNEQIETSMLDHNVLIINPVDRLSVFSVIQKAILENNKIIFFNREPLNSDLNEYVNAYYVGADAKQSAQLQAELIMDLFGTTYDLNEHDLNQDNSIQAVILKGEQGHQDAEARTEYVVKTLQDAGYNIQILDIDVSNWDRSEAKNTVLEWNNSLTGIELIISNNDAMALGAIEALVELNIIQDTNLDGQIDQVNEPWLPVVGIDGLDEALLSIDTGYLYGTIMNDSQRMAEVIVELSDLLMKNQDLSNLSIPVVDGKYIWINYRKLTLTVE